MERRSRAGRGSRRSLRKVGCRNPGNLVWRGLFAVVGVCGLIGFAGLYGCQQSSSYHPSRDLPYMVLSDENWENVKALSDRVGDVFRFYSDLFQVTEESVPQLEITVTGSRPGVQGSDAGTGSADEYPALYRAAPPRIVFRRPPDGSLVLHEVAHHFILLRTGRRLATCLNEGLATYLGWLAVGENGPILGDVALEHGRTAQRAARAGKLIPLATFAAMPAERFYAPQMKKMHYSQAWALVFFLLHSYWSDDLPFHEKVDLIADITAEELTRLEPAFTSFCRGFPARQLLEERLASRDEVCCCSAAFRLGLLQDRRASDPLLAIARDRSRAAKVRVVALWAAGIIFLGPDGAEAGESFFAALHELEQDSDAAVEEHAKELRLAVERGDASTIQSRYGAIGCDTPFYPAGRIKVYSE